MKRLVPYLFFLGLSTQLDLGKFGASWYKKMKKPKDQSRSEILYFEETGEQYGYQQWGSKYPHAKNHFPV